MKSQAKDELAIGIEAYATDLKGTGGRTKTLPEDFLVSEVLVDDSKKLFLRKRSGGYPLYVLCKRNVGTLEARERVQWATGMSMNALGLKDKRALTYQFLSARKKAEEPTPEVREGDFVAKWAAETVRPLKRVDLLGNFFRVRIHGFNGEESDANQVGDLLDSGGLPNFFGSQRFGRDRPNQLVGEAIVRRKFADAARMLLDQELAESEAILALRRVPLALRQLLVQSYQSYLFNRMLSAALERHGSLPTDAWTYMAKGRTTPLVNESYFRDPSGVGHSFMAVPLGQLPGFAFRNRHDSYSVALADVLEEAGITPKDFFIKEMQELSLEGGYRPAPMVGWYKGCLMDACAEVRLGLYSGCYATVFLRELMKPADPTASGL